MNLLLKDIESTTFAGISRGCDIITIGNEASKFISPEYDFPMIKFGKNCMKDF